MGCSKSSSKREVYSNTILPQETSQINNLTLHLKQLEKEEQKKTPKLAKGKIINIRSEGFPGGTVVKNPPANAEDTGSSPGLGRSHMPRSN